MRIKLYVFAIILGVIALAMLVKGNQPEEYEAKAKTEQSQREEDSQDQPQSLAEIEAETEAAKARAAAERVARLAAEARIQEYIERFGPLDEE